MSFSKKLSLLLMVAATTLTQAGNPEHLKKFRETGECIGCDLSYYDFVKDPERRSGEKEMNFTNANLRGANFMGSNLKGLTFKGTNFRASAFVNANLKNTTFQDTPTNGALFLHAKNLDFAKFDEQSLKGNDNLIEYKRYQLELEIELEQLKEFSVKMNQEAVEFEKMPLYCFFYDKEYEEKAIRVFAGGIVGHALALRWHNKTIELDQKVNLLKEKEKSKHMMTCTEH